MGAVANLAPELFAGILANVPFVDPLTSILDPSLPLTVIEWDEWGDPLHNKDVYDYMRSYSPYENVEAKDYPAILAITSINDTRVLYVEPAKWVAKLRATKTGDAPATSQDRDERRTRRCQWSVREVERGRVRVRLGSRHGWRKLASVSIRFGDCQVLCQSGSAVTNLRAPSAARTRSPG